MKKDSQRRLQIPNSLLKDVGILPGDEIRIKIHYRYIELFNAKDKTIKGKEYHDVVKLDSKGRIVISKRLEEYYNPKGNDYDYRIAAKDGKIIIRWRQERIEGE